MDNRIPAFYTDPLSLDFTDGEPFEDFVITNEQFAAFMQYEPPEDSAGDDYIPAFLRKQAF